MAATLIMLELKPLAQVLDRYFQYLERLGLVFDRRFVPLSGRRGVSG